MRNTKKECEALQRRYEALWREKEEAVYERNRLKRQEAHFVEQGNRILELHEKVRSLKHDMKNHMLVLATYLEEGNEAAAKSYISEILDQLNAIHSYIETDNALMNHILNQKLEEARRKKITVKAEIENLAFQKMESMDFTAVLSNLLDNAIEACEKEETKDLQVTIGKRRGYEMILVKNKIAHSVLEDNPDLISDKEEKSLHGMGVKKIRALTEKYDGLCDFYEKEHYFCACVFIPE